MQPTVDCWQHNTATPPHWQRADRGACSHCTTAQKLAITARTTVKACNMTAASAPCGAHHSAVTCDASLTWRSAARHWRCQKATQTRPAKRTQGWLVDRRTHQQAPRATGTDAMAAASHHHVSVGVKADRTSVICQRGHDAFRDGAVNTDRARVQASHCCRTETRGIAA